MPIGRSAWGLARTASSWVPPDANLLAGHGDQGSSRVAGAHRCACRARCRVRAARGQSLAGAHSASTSPIRAASSRRRPTRSTPSRPQSARAQRSSRWTSTYSRRRARGRFTTTTVDRTTDGTGSVDELSLEQIKPLDAAYRFIEGRGHGARRDPSRRPTSCSGALRPATGALPTRLKRERFHDPDARRAARGLPDHADQHRAEGHGLDTGPARIGGRRSSSRLWTRRTT